MLAAEPIWITAARAGRQVLVLQASQGAPFTNQYPDRLLQFDVFDNELARMLLVEGSVAAGPHRFTIGDQPASIAAGPDGSVHLIVGDQQARLFARPGERWSRTMRVRTGGRDGFFRAGLVSYDSRIGRVRVDARTRVGRLVEPSRRAGPFRRRRGTIMDHGLVPMYARGRFGPTLVQGGAGEAEDLFAEALSVNQEYMDGSLEYAATKPLAAPRRLQREPRCHPARPHGAHGSLQLGVHTRTSPRACGRISKSCSPDPPTSTSR